VFEVWQVGDYILANNLIGSALGRGYVWDETTIYRKVVQSPCLSKVRPIVDHIIVQTSFKSLHQCHKHCCLSHEKTHMHPRTDQRTPRIGFWLTR
jgi:hypothetical protein